MPLFSDEEIGNAAGNWADRIAVRPDERAALQQERYRQLEERQRLHREAEARRLAEAKLKQPATWGERILAEAKMGKIAPRALKEPGFSERMDTLTRGDVLPWLEASYPPAGRAGPKPVDEDLLFSQAIRKTRESTAKQLNPKGDPSQGARVGIATQKELGSDPKWGGRPELRQSRAVIEKLERIRAEGNDEAMYDEAEKMAQSERFGELDPMARKTILSYTRMGGKKRAGYSPLRLGGGTRYGEQTY